jgi:hypothetical protein
MMESRGREARMDARVGHRPEGEAWISTLSYNKGGMKRDEKGDGS